MKISSADSSPKAAGLDTWRSASLDWYDPLTCADRDPGNQSGRYLMEFSGLRPQLRYQLGDWTLPLARSRSSKPRRSYRALISGSRGRPVSRSGAWRELDFLHDDVARRHPGGAH